MSAKPKKLSKAEQARLKKEEEDRAIKEEQERIWNEKIATKMAALKKERRDIEKQNRATLEQSSTMYGSFINDFNTNLDSTWDSYINQKVADSIWSRFMNCEPMPDFNITKDIAEFSTWITLEKNKLDNVLENVDSKSNQIKCCMDNVKDMLNVLGSYNEYDEYSDEHTVVYNEMKSTINEMLNKSTLEFLKSASKYKDEDTGNVQIEESDEFHNIYLWGNLANNPRLKTINFGNPEKPGSHVQINLLKNMHSRSLALRIVSKNYNSLSVENETKDKKNLENLASQEEIESNDPINKYPLTPLESEKDETEEAVDPEDPEQIVSDTIVTDEKVEEPTKNEENPAKDGETEEPVVENDVEVESKTSETTLKEEKDNYPPDYYSLDDYAITGGTWDFDIFEIPPQSKKSGKWTIKRVYDDENLSNINDDVIFQAGVVSKMALTENTSSENVSKQDQEPKIPEPILLNIKIYVPNNQVLLAPPEIGIYDNLYKCWRSEGISNVEFDENSRAISFTTSKFGKFAALQDKKLDLPYQGWSLTKKITSEESVDKFVEKLQGDVEFELLANYTEMKLRVDEISKDVNIVHQIHEEVSGTSLVKVEESRLELEEVERTESQEDVKEEDAEPEEVSNFDDLRIDRPFKSNDNTGDTAVADLKQTLMNKSVYLFPSLEQPCSLIKIYEMEKTIYFQMAVLVSLGICQFTYTILNSTQPLPKEEVTEVSPKNSNETVKSKSSNINVDEEDSRPSSPDVSIPISEDENYRPLREFEMIIKFAKIVNNNLNLKNSTSNFSFNKFESTTSFQENLPEWKLLFTRWPSGPTYVLNMEENENETIFSREIAPGSKYHIDLLHAVCDEFELDVDVVHKEAKKLDLVYLKTVYQLLLETRVLTNSV